MYYQYAWFKEFLFIFIRKKLILVFANLLLFKKACKNMCQEIFIFAVMEYKGSKRRKPDGCASG